jgi:hypothetical protein
MWLVLVVLFATTYGLSITAVPGTVILPFIKNRLTPVQVDFLGEGNDWVNKSNVLVANDNSANCFLTSFGKECKYLVASNFGFSVPHVTLQN